MNNSTVAHNWAHGAKGSGSHLRTDGVTLTSYYTTIAARIGGIIYLSADNMSPSTSRHISYARQAVNHEREKIFYTHAFSWSGSNPALTHEAMILPEAEGIINDLETALATTKTRQVTKIKAIDEYMTKKARIQKIAGITGVKLPAMPEIQSDPESIAVYQESKRLQEEKKEAARVAAQKKQQKEDLKQYKAWLKEGTGRFPMSFTIRGSDQITIKGDYVTYRNQKDFPGEAINAPVLKVVTSQGAECPLDHAIKALRFWESRNQRISKPAASTPCTIFEPYQTNGHKIHLGNFTLDSIDEAGTVKAGCHTFTAQEISRFISQWSNILSL